MDEILVTGITGFIGNHLVPELSKNYKILGISKNKKKSTKNFKLRTMDITKSDFISRIPFSKIVHMAAYSDVNYCNLNPTKCFELNVKSTQKMLEVARKNDSSFIFLSSSHVYGTPQKLPLSEKDPCYPLTHYAASKKMSEILCETYSQTYDLDIRIARIFSVYGPKSPKSNLVFNIMNQMINNSKIKLGNTSPKRDFIFISDVINGLIKIINSKRKGFQTYNIGSGNSTSVKEIVKTCLKIHGKNLELISSKEKIRKNEISDIYANITKMKSEFNWKPQVSLKRGLEITYNYYN
ncbi:NAD-dependent dehydratase [Nitrosopumilus zosterae]|uniref:NAD-dependent dehydratase n=1 Tax=Nitrosopumilus zosterae TaxID=718286 RepID=A0A2S2KU53_9ARCH|nr:NAD(P)-dependent oxidoreductase [Nitrosopumilus zosterae]BDQ31822.1 NAD(P)-dependent oxidoreductase [Nitrosopumilus zosterae]GBH35172.1 NAD-dependent dehydratase [Nitrosopumilus zosterae]